MRTVQELMLLRRDMQDQLITMTGAGNNKSLYPDYQGLVESLQEKITLLNSMIEQYPLIAWVMDENIDRSVVINHVPQPNA